VGIRAKSANRFHKRRPTITLPKKPKTQEQVAMGLDTVEVVLRAEELYAITIEDDKAAAVSTVGDLYDLICSKLTLTPLQSPITSAELPEITHKEKTFLFLYKHTPLPAPPEVLPWSPQSVWDVLVAIFVDQLQIEGEEVIPSARIAEDLRCD
jgi:acyl carrier protein